MTDHKIGTREEWLAAREQLLAREKEHTRLGDELARQRRELPWVPVEKEYRFDTDDGERTLDELFDGRSQLLVYHFMFGPSYQAGCPVNSSIADTVDGLLPHLHARDATFVFVSQAPLEKLQAYKRRMGWSFPWVSSAHTDFNFDLGFSYTEEQAREAVAQMRATGLTIQTSATGPETGTGLPPIVEHNARSTRHRRRRLPHREPRVQHLRARRRRRLPRVLDDVARIGVPHGLLPDPRPRTEGPRRGRGVAALDPPARRVRRRVTRSSERSAPPDSARRGRLILPTRGRLLSHRRQSSSGDRVTCGIRTGAVRGSLQLKGAIMSAVPTIHRFPVEHEGAFVNAYLVETASGVVAVDGLLQVSAAREMRAGLDRLGKPLLAALLTHSHPDHYAGLGEIVAGARRPDLRTAGSDRHDHGRRCRQGSDRRSDVRGGLAGGIGSSRTPRSPMGRA